MEVEQNKPQNTVPMVDGTPREAPPEPPPGFKPAAPAAAEAAPQGQAAQNAQPAKPEGRGEKTVTIRRADLAKQVKEGRASGADALARELGFANAEEARAARAKAPAANARGKGATPPNAAGKGKAAAPVAPPADAPAAPQGSGDAGGGRELARLRRENDELKRKCAELAARCARAEKAQRATNKTLLAVQGENEARLAVVRAGGTRVDYILHQMRNHCASLSEEQLSKFDENAYLAQLRRDEPYLFGQHIVQPTTTAEDTNPGLPASQPQARVQQQPAQQPQGGGAPPPPSRRDIANGQQPTVINARDMTPQAYREHLRRRGLQDPSRNPSTPAIP